MIKKPGVLIIIVNYNHGDCLRELIKSVLNTDYPNFTVVLIDNASHDKSRTIIESFNDNRLKKILLSENIGLCASRNLGANNAEDSYFAFLDADVKVTPSWLNSLVKVMESNTTVGIGESTIKSKVSYGRSSEEIVKLFALGASFIVRNDVWQELGGFDPAYFFGYDDADLGWRSWMLGYSVIRVPDSIVYHAAGLIRKGPRVRVLHYHDFKNRLSSLMTNLEAASLFKEMPRIIVTVVRDFLRDFREGQITSLISTFWVLRNLPILFSKRKLLQSGRRLRDSEIASLWDPFVRGSLHENRLSIW